MITPRNLTLRCAAAMLGAAGAALPAHAGDRPTIMLVGYWPPSNEAVRPFSDDPVQNPGGWIGENWEGRGYDIYAYFPEFTPPNCNSCGKGTGDFEVDYQDTSADWWTIVNQVKPVAIITFSRTGGNFSWEAEMNCFNRATWINDYVDPRQPTPAPPDDSVPAGTLRPSRLPVEQIVVDIDAANLGLNAFVCYSNSAGGFLSEFLGYHGVWYQAIHNHPDDPDFCVAAGHVHVGDSIAWSVARMAAQVTLRTVIDYIDPILDVPGDLTGDGVIDVFDLVKLLSDWGSCETADVCESDVVIDGDVNIFDLIEVLERWTV